jgi:uncharacterized OB-fold protein
MSSTSAPETLPVAPEPVVEAETEGFWAGLREGEIRASVCVDCGAATLRVERCVSCGSDHRRWEPVKGAGAVKSFVVFHRAYHPYWATQVPYNVAVITLPEGVEILTNVVDCDNSELTVGARVRLEIRKRGDHPAVVAVPA